MIKINKLLIITIITIGFGCGSNNDENTRNEKAKNYYTKYLNEKKQDVKFLTENYIGEIKKTIPTMGSFIVQEYLIGYEYYDKMESKKSKSLAKYQIAFNNENTLEENACNMFDEYWVFSVPSCVLKLDEICLEKEIKNRIKELNLLK